MNVDFSFTTPFYVFFCFVGFLFSGESFAVEVKDIRIAQQEGETRLVFELDKSTDHRLFSLSNPDRVVLDISGSTFPASSQEALKSLPSGVLKKVRFAQRDNGTRFVLDLSKAVKSKSSTLSASGKFGPRILVELEYGPTKKAPPVVSKSLSSLAAIKRDVVIVIDAGHGGKDPGAIGKYKVREKDIVLSIAKELAKNLSALEGFKPVLTRSSDVYLPLRDRSQVARNANADLLISIHADAFTKSSARGASVWALSLSGKTSEMGRWLAEQEQSSELVGGISLDDKDQLLAEVLLDMSMNSTIQFSLNIGSSVLGEMGRVAKLHKSTVQQAGFVVLKSPDIPSILIETGFVSNATEAKNLGSYAYRKKLASAIAKGVKASFMKNPPEGTLLAWKQNQTRSTIYTVTKGDTLSEIAKKNSVSLSRLRGVNSLKNDVIWIGQKLRIPSS
ncbi:N-acetylmuramoyl-L-alanine amidase [Marinomonas algicola]|uniref:N-acetylmuramoyl-L-alanine amidase n=1 Tax=Marinomonas algicola TaxID=2773454 RepID=UPI00174C2134|nr:N-acetylmuramoyl-L-alanine amidase [Marinomonas algicola]